MNDVDFGLRMWPLQLELERLDDGRFPRSTFRESRRIFESSKSDDERRHPAFGFQASSSRNFIYLLSKPVNLILPRFQPCPRLKIVGAASAIQAASSIEGAQEITLRPSNPILLLLQPLCTSVPLVATQPATVDPVTLSVRTAHGPRTLSGRIRKRVFSSTAYFACLGSLSSVPPFCEGALTQLPWIYGTTALESDLQVCKTPISIASHPSAT
ncbi:hypothetical protein B0H15DRAFT_945699 [Mycena belliarum]|uniref:Uncharacterized protein n=1 Tax=Mycena belliarum TaxID=1033014 RepID=A0AAD6UF82_9AGAR|nr:hypothetical protein B0H15DRAFT_945699 [Mycena belliae]